MVRNWSVDICGLVIRYELYIEGVYDVIRFKVRVKMGEEGDVEFLPVQFDLNLVFKFIGNHLEMDMGAWLKYNEIKFYEGAARRKSQKKHHHEPDGIL